MTPKRHISSTQLLLLLLILPTCSLATFLWFEAAPLRDDPCTVTVTGLSKERVYADIHPSPQCSEGGLLWFGTWGRIHAHFSLDNTTESNFKLCFTGGMSNAIFIWYNYRDKYWEPLGFPGYMGLLHENETCRYSHRGILDVFFESPWSKPNYMSFLTWEVTRMPAGWVDEEHAEDEDIITIFDKKETPPEKEEEEGSFQDTIIQAEKDKASVKE